MIKNLHFLKSPTIRSFIFSFLIIFIGLSHLSAQTVQVETTGGCYNNDNPRIFNLTGSDGGSPPRNIYRYDFNSSGNDYSILSWSSANNRWEFIYIGTTLDLWSTYASYPNPPDLATGNWQADAFCGTINQLDGSGTQNNFLPVEYVSFNAEASDEGIRLKWVTASELNNEKIEIEHSSDGINFKYIEEVAGSGTSFEMINYEFIDYNALSGTNYYRLKQIDFDGTFEYSDVVSVDFSAGKNFFRIAPNPTSGASTVAFNFEEDSREKTLTIYNTLGAKVFQTFVEEDQSSIEIVLPNLSQGIYTAEVISGRTRSTERMFIK